MLYQQLYKCNQVLVCVATERLTGGLEGGGIAVGVCTLGPASSAYTGQPATSNTSTLHEHRD